jgi:serine/threonine protein kinase
MNLLLDKYQIIRVIGKGGMGTVYEAREVALGRRVAIKWMHGRSFAEDDPDLLRFQQEARIAAALERSVSMNPAADR